MRTTSSVRAGPKLRILRFDGELAAGSRLGRATRRVSRVVRCHEHPPSEDWFGPAMSNIDVALTHFESPHGDPMLAAWGEWPAAASTIADASTSRSTLADARHCRRRFEVWVPREMQVVRTSSKHRCYSTLPPKHGKESQRRRRGQRAKKLLTALRVDPALSAYERAVAISFSVIMTTTVDNFADARTILQAAISA